MAGYVVCGCCGRQIPATAADVGRAVVCPTSRQLVMVNPGDLREVAAPAAPEASAPRGRKRLAVALLLLLALGLGGYLAADKLRGPKPSNGETASADPAKATPTEPVSVEVKPQSPVTDGVSRRRPSRSPRPAPMSSPPPPSSTRPRA